MSRFFGLVTGGPLKPDFGLSGHFQARKEFSRFLLASGLFGLDFNSPLAARCVMEKAAPRPVFGARAQSFFHRVPMNVVQFLYELQKAGKQVQFMIYPKSRHGVTDPVLVKHMQQMMTDFILGNL